MKDKKILKIVLTGGPMAGKSSILTYIKKYFGDKVEIIPEIATNFEKSVLIDKYFFKSFLKKDLNKFFFIVQTQLESIYVKVAKKKNVGLVVCDRGLLDGAAYYPGGAKNFLRINNASFKKIYNRYDAVIWLETFVKTDKKKCIKIRNLNRTEFSSALEISKNNLENWQSHHNFYKVESLSMDEKRKNVLMIINDLLNK